jgi:hypothetical protein
MSFFILNTDVYADEAAVLTVDAGCESGSPAPRRAMCLTLPERDRDLVKRPLRTAWAETTRDGARALDARRRAGPAPLRPAASLFGASGRRRP